MAVNKVVLIGNVGKDPEIKYFDNGSAVANFPLATTERGYTAANGTQVPERTEWHNIVLWRGLAKVAEQYVKKGSQVYIEGKIRSRTYDDQQGIKRYVYEIYADNMELLGKRGGDDSSAMPAKEMTSAAPQVSTQPTSKENASSGEEELPF